jgi:Ni2+-binding GTPase involved in maturation of urease and hydrogenase
MIIILRGETAMLKENLEILREQINIMIISEDISDENLLKVSQELDILIIEFMRKQK